MPSHEYLLPGPDKWIYDAPKGSPEDKAETLFIQLAKDPSEGNLRLAVETQQNHINNALNDMNSFRFAITSLGIIDECKQEEARPFDKRYYSGDFYYQEVDYMESQEWKRRSYKELFPHQKPIVSSEPFPKLRQIFERIKQGRPIVDKYYEIVYRTNVFYLEREFLEKNKQTIIYPNYWNNLVTRNVDCPREYMFINLMNGQYQEYNKIPFSAVILPEQEKQTEAQKDVWRQLYEKKDRILSWYGSNQICWQ